MVDEAGLAAAVGKANSMTVKTNAIKNNNLFIATPLE
jgi:hypothetical protein